MQRSFVLVLAVTLLFGCTKKTEEVREGRSEPLQVVEVQLSEPAQQVAPAPEPAYRLAPSMRIALDAPDAMAVPPPLLPGSVSPNERYAALTPNPIKQAAAEPVSTFSIDVDTGSFSNVRRMLEAGIQPPPEAVRTEEFLNWFDYDYPAPADLSTPFSVTTELAAAPWNPNQQLILIGIKGYELQHSVLPPANLVFLIDTSGSMQEPNKIGLVKQCLRLVIEQLRPVDHVAIVTYAGSAGLVLPSTPGNRRSELDAAVERLQAGGSTNGGAGIALAYAVAEQHFVPGGVNRVILATDGDFNVGLTSLDELKSMVEARRKTGIALTTLGFGQDNYNDELAEQLADIGDGNHAYIDRIEEGRKVLVEELGATLLTIARDVKVQLEFNPAEVVEYRLLGYENRALKREDFANDTIDAGEIGAGHDVTALYELRLNPQRSNSATLAQLRLRYKSPEAERSRLIEQTVKRSAIQATMPPRLELAAAVTVLAERLRGSPAMQNFDLDAGAKLTHGSRLCAVKDQCAALIDMLGAAATLDDLHSAGAK